MKQKTIFKRLIICSVAAIMLLGSFPMIAGTDDTATIHVSHGEAQWASSGSKSETWYAYNAYDSTMDEGPISFPNDDPSDITLIGPMGSTGFLTGGCFVEDVWYVCEYYDGGDYPDDKIWTIDPTDGTYTEVGEYGLTESLNGLAYDDSTETLYGCSGTNLYTVDLVDGSATLVGALNSGGLMVGIACDGEGTLYGIDLGDESLYSIDPSTGDSTLIGSTGLTLNYAQDMAYDKNNDLLYLAAYEDPGDGSLQLCDTTDGSTTSQGAFGVLEVTAFAIPYDFYTPEHDISVTDLDVADTVPHGDTQTVSAMVNNIGNNTETGVVVDFKVDSTVIDSTTITSIDPEESIPVSFSWDPAVGNYFVEIESQPITDEEDLANNAVNKTVDVILAPDIDVAPTTLTFMIPADDSDSQILTITNLPIAEAVLDYTITVDDGGSGWLSALPSSGTVAIDDYDDITVSVDSIGLTEGTYDGELVVDSNDLNNPEITVPVQLFVVYADDMAAISINHPTGTIYDISHVVSATVQNMGSNPQTDVTVNCSIFEGGIGGDVINEDFSTEPVDWTITDVGGTAWEWDSTEERMENTYGSNPPNEGYLDSPVLDCSGKSGITLEFWHYWKADYSSGDQDGYVRGSIDGGATWPYLIDEFHHNDPAEEDAVKSYDISSWADNQAQVMIRFDVYNDNDWYWRIDDFVVNAAITGDLVYSSETLVSLAAYEQQYVEFSPAWNADIGTYGIQITTLLAGDENIGNDIVSDVVIVEELPMPVINTDTGEGFNNIQPAIDDVDTLDGHTIVVHPGTYIEQVTIDKSLSILGDPGAIIQCPAGPAEIHVAESTAQFGYTVGIFGGTYETSNTTYWGSGALTVEFSGFTIDSNDTVPADRFCAILNRNINGGSSIHDNTITNTYVNGKQTFGILGYGDMDITIENNHVDQFGRGGIGLYSGYAEVLGNTVIGDDNTTWATNGIQLGYGASGLVDGNDVSYCGWPGSAWAGTGILICDTSDVVVNDNYVHDSEQAIGVVDFPECYYGGSVWAGVVSNVDVTNNIVEANAWGIVVANDASDITIEGNSIIDTNGDAIDVYCYDACAPPPTGVEIHYNNIENCGYDGIWIGPLVTETVDATCNWYGDASGPYHATQNPSGLGESVVGNASFIPWLTDSYPGGECNGYPGPVYNVDTGELFNEIQTAIDDVDTLDTHTIVVSAGTFVEDVNVDKGLTLIGLDPYNAVIDGTVDITADDVTMQQFTVAPTTVFSSQEAGVAIYGSNIVFDDNIVDGVTGDGTSFFTIKGIHVYGGATQISNILIQNNEVKNIHNQNFSAPTVYGGADGIMIQGNCIDVEVVGNLIQDIHSAGWAYGLDVTPTNIPPTPPNPQNVLIHENTIDTVNDGSVFDSVYGGIGFTVDETSPGADDGDASQVTLEYNNFINLVYGAINKDTSEELYAECNWWGDITGPFNSSTNPGGAGAEVYGDISFLPWLTDTYPEGDCTGGLEQLDIEQTVQDRGFPIRHALDGDWAGAQNFTPTLNHVSKVELYLRVFGTPEFDMTVELRLDGPQGTLLDTIVFTPSEVPTSWTWFEVDFEDQYVGIGSDVFVVIPPAPSGVTTSFGYEWGYAFGDQYDDGSFWFTRDGGGLWRDLPEVYEFAFKTFGY